MLFNRLGKAIVRHHKLIIVIWVLALLVAIPFAPQAYDAVIYEETQGSSEQELPSEEAPPGTQRSGDRFLGVFPFFVATFAAFQYNNRLRCGLSRGCLLWKRR